MKDRVKKRPSKKDGRFMLRSKNSSSAVWQNKDYSPR